MTAYHHRRRNHRGTLAIILLAATAAIAALWYFGSRGPASGMPLANSASAAESLALAPETPAAPAPVAPSGAPAGRPYIHIDKQTMTLTLYDADGAVRARFGVATGQAPGNKRRRGDMRTPEGSFSISQIQDASSWTHDFGDGNGVIQGAYGPRFLRLETPGFRGIGIHGTHDPASIGTRASEGCIRLRNENVDSLARMVTVGTPVIITPGDADRAANAQ